MNKKETRPAGGLQDTGTREAPDKSLWRPSCSMARHTGAVTTVKFSPSGRFLATGSDDRVVLIWEKDEELSQRPKAFGETQSELEHWTVRKRLVAHDNDVQDIAWAPDCSILVTVGLDRSIIIWSGSNFDKLKRFDIHNSHVKGVVFDPANKYFATASDDRSVLIFRYHKTTASNEMTFSIEHKVTKPFAGSPLTSYFRRLSWSPDGLHIAVPNATNGPVTSVAVINRGDWNSDISLIGHSSPCEVTAFSPRLYELSVDESGGRLRAKNKKPKVCSVVATAGQDRVLAIWSTSSTRPLLVANDICYKTVTDLAWSPDGSKLFLSSLDGSITVLFFGPNELGTEVPLEANDSYLYRYGGDRESVVFPESVDQLKLEEQAITKNSGNPLKLEDQIITNKSGNQSKLEDQTIKNKSVNQSKLEEQKKSVIENKMEKLMKKKMPPAKITPENSLKIVDSLLSKITKPITTLTPRKKIQQVVKITKDGKKRVAPMLMTTTSLKPASKEFSSAIASTAQQVREYNLTKKNLLSSSLYKIPNMGVKTLVSGLRERKHEPSDLLGDEDADNSTLKLYSSQKNNSNTTKHRKSTAKKYKDLEYPPYLRDIVQNSIQRVAFANYNEYCVRNRSTLVVLSESQNKLSNCGSKVSLHIQNNYEFDKDDKFLDNEHSTMPTRVVSTDENSKKLFETFLPHSIVNCIGNEELKLWILVSDQGSIFLLSFAGKLLYPRIDLGSNICAIRNYNKYLMAICNDSLLYLWDITLFKILCSKVSLAPIINEVHVFISKDPKDLPPNFKNDAAATPQRKFLACEINTKGTPIFIVDDGSLFAWSFDLCSWVNLGNVALSDLATLEV